MKITEKAMILFARILISCRALGIINPIEKAIVFLAQKGKKINISEFERGLAVKTDLFNNLTAVAGDLDKAEIDREVILSYFGGERHINKIHNMIMAESDNYSGRSGYELLLRHTLFGIVITSQEGDCFSGKYSNSGRTVHISHLVPFEKDKNRIRIGGKVFIHFNSIVKVDPEQRFWNSLMECQAKSEHFMKAVECFDGQNIAYEKGLQLVKKALATYRI